MANQKNEPKLEQQQLNTHEEEQKSSLNKELQALTIAELNAISGGVISYNHNETVVKLAHLSRKPKPSSEDKSVKVTKLPTLTIAELNAIAGGKLGANHNETMIKCSKSN